MLASVLLLSFAFASLSWGKETAGEGDKERYERGREMMNRKEWADAAQLFSDLARGYPEDADVFLRLGVALFEAQRYPEAEKALKEAIRLDPKGVSAHLQLAQLFEATQRLQEAFNVYDQITKIDPDGEAMAPSLLKKKQIGGILRARAGNLEGALRQFQEAVEMAPDDPAGHYNVGLVHLLRKEEALAEAAFQKVVSLNPRHQDGYLNLGNLYERQNRIREALEAFTRAVEIDPRSPGGRSAQIVKLPLLQGIFLARQGNFNDALRVFDQALRISPEPAPIYFQIGLIYSFGGLLPKAEEAFLAAIRADPRHQGATFQLGSLYERQEKLEEAIRLYDLARELGPQTQEGKDAAVNGHNARGKLASLNGRLDEALAEFIKARDLQPTNPLNFFNLGQIHLQRRELPEAEKAFEEVIRLNPQEREAYIKLADIQERSGRDPEAIETYQKVLALGPGPFETHAAVRFHILKGVAAANREDFPDARSEFEEVVRLNPKDKIGYLNLALVHQKLRDPYRALIAFRHAYDIDPKDQSVRIRLANLYEDLGRPKEAYDFYQSVLEEGGDEELMGLIRERVALLFGTISLGYNVTYDSNINLSPIAVSDFHSDVLVQYQRLFDLGEGWRVGLRLTPSVSFYHRNQIAFFSGQGGFFVERRGFQRGLTLSYQIRTAFFEGSLSDRSHELAVEGFRATGPSSMLSGSFRVRTADSFSNQALDGVQPSASASWSGDLPGWGRFTLSNVFYANLNTQEIGDDYAYVAGSPSINYDRPIPTTLFASLMANFNYSYTYSWYLHKDSLVVGNQRRVNQGHMIGGGVTATLDKGLTFYARGIWQVNTSNLAGVPLNTAAALSESTPQTSYRKWIGIIGLRLFF